ncbi:head-tail connector protein [Kordiimonas sp. SCSIO 12610]|uniref:head-tail connector protein n=1 Tax=Kordiimonas sp. SCSIO 12610 TaxID=2829597 RepID=UPI00210E102E|nr:head-tail connector protein [Kordiimonas sp. SCSIO 12610]UTW56184.1 head-tail connector protein [Kordiimonas sp. SCSIO 12610]
MAYSKYYTDGGYDGRGYRYSGAATLNWQNAPDGVNGPKGDPILLAEVKDHLRLSHEDEDAYIGSLIAVAVQKIEQHFGLALMERHVDITINGTLRDHIFRLPVRPVSEVISVTSIDGDGAEVPGETLGETIIPASAYSLQPGLGARLIFKNSNLTYGVGHGFIPVPRQQSLRIRARAGFGLSHNLVPADIRHALLILTAYFYNYRGDDSDNPLADAMAKSGAMALMAPYRDYRL